MKKNKTNFGFSEINIEEKEPLVKEVFSSVASKYDLMNDIMSFGLHRLWKRYIAADIAIKDNDHILDLAAGSGDLSILFKKKNPKASVIHSDINQSMLEEGQKKIIDQGLIISSMLINAEQIPFPDNSFNLVSISFGLRNMTNKQSVLNEVFRCLKPGGRIVILEFSKIHPSLEKIYDLFSFKIIPRIGKKIADDEKSYQYLAESIRVHPDQATLLQMLNEAGFCKTKYTNLSAGIVAVHSGYKS
ncbi:class I SAM-dependent methyltransferase [Methylophilaceae bacterium]|nr:class I SAM-dependent methyltransferase [Methylophilaceae bacterium]